MNILCCESHPTFFSFLGSLTPAKWDGGWFIPVEVSVVTVPGISIKILKFSCFYEGLGALDAAQGRPRGILISCTAEGS